MKLGANRSIHSGSRELDYKFGDFSFRVDGVDNEMVYIYHYDFRTERKMPMGMLTKQEVKKAIEAFTALLIKIKTA